MEIETWATAGILSVAGVLVAWWLLRHRHALRRVHLEEVPEHLQRMVPTSLHPHIDPTVCIGSAACVAACPEGQILALHRGRALLVQPNACIGHGRCAAECPVGAISLVFGTSERGVDIPHVSQHFETNVPGVYIVGELGGMGLIRNAVAQGLQAVEHIARQPRPSGETADLLIVGAGPAGMAASLAARKLGLRATTIDQESLGGTIGTYPRRKLVMLAPFDLPFYGRVKARQMHKEELLAIWRRATDAAQVDLRAGVRLDDLRRDGDAFVATTSAGELRAARVILAIGRRGTPRKLGVAGEDQPHVAYSLREPEAFEGLSVLVVGGGDSAIEAAVRLSELPGTRVVLSYRREVFDRAKPKNVAAVEAAAGRLTLALRTEVRSIGAKDAVLSTPEGDQTIPADQVLIFAGGQLPLPLLQRVGIVMERRFGTA